MLSRKVSKFSITFILGISPDSALVSVSEVLRNRRESKSEVIFSILSLVCCVPMIITLSLFIGFEHASNDCKVEKVNYEFGIASFQR
jgi:hypothetical protein